jgi:DNA-binding XRE family transcriptional regulator
VPTGGHVREGVRGLAEAPGGPGLTLEREHDSVEVWSLGRGRFAVEAPSGEHVMFGFEAARANRQLIQLRVDAGLSATDLAYKAGVSAKSVRLAELGFIPGPRVQYAIAQVFGLRPTELFPLDLQRRARRGR